MTEPMTDAPLSDAEERWLRGLHKDDVMAREWWGAFATIDALRAEIERLRAQVAAVRDALTVDHGAHSRADYMVLVQAARAALGATPPDDTEGGRDG